MSTKNRGFTLTELMITLAIAAIIAAIAFPSFLDQVRRSRRAEAKSSLEALAQVQERFYARFRTYTSVVIGTPSGCITGSTVGCGLGQATAATANGYYTLTAAGSVNGYNITATAVGDQLKDEICRNLRINSLGTRVSTGSDGANTTATCW